MIRYQCLLCGKLVEFLKIYGKVKRKDQKCSCGGELVPLENNNHPNEGGISNENSYASQERSGK